jgi:hypothetical protein
MEPQSPVVEGFEDHEVLIGKDNRLYKPLPAIYVENDSRVVSRWRLSLRERLKVLFSGNIYIFIRTYGEPLQPISVGAEKPQLEIPDDL